MYSRKLYFLCLYLTKYSKLIASTENTAKYKRIMKHELCHQDQYNDSRLDNCGLNPFGFPGARMIDEAECYSGSWTSTVLDLLQFPRHHRNRPNWADQAAEFIWKKLS